MKLTRKAFLAFLAGAPPAAKAAGKADLYYGRKTDYLKPAKAETKPDLIVQSHEAIARARKRYGEDVGLG